eukprot:c10551_g1_i1.p1 GENE.c10551_g1_i1~~c10551_g1_i1.p1  ORF type:complete len:184 (-),score=33.74 c10551_g1_i1:117-623(-)
MAIDLQFNCLKGKTLFEFHLTCIILATTGVVFGLSFFCFPALGRFTFDTLPYPSDTSLDCRGGSVDSYETLVRTISALVFALSMIFYQVSNINSTDTPQIRKALVSALWTILACLVVIYSLHVSQIENFFFLFVGVLLFNILLLHFADVQVDVKATPLAEKDEQRTNP